MTWAILGRSENQLDGKREYLQGRYFYKAPDVPDFVSGYKIMVFKTREQARAHVREHCINLRERPDLRKEPHGWKPPKIVKVNVLIEVRNA